MIGLKYKAAITISRFFVAIMIIVVIVFGVKTLLENWKEGAVTLHPKKTLIVIIDSSQREKFFEQLTRFADAYAFKIHIGPTTPAGNTFNVNMSRKDVVFIANNVFDPKKFNISAYDQNPANPVSEDLINNLFNNLKKFLGEVPNIRISDGT